MEKSKLKILIPSYNHEKYIEKCINSILNQSKREFDLKIIDDGSTDNSDSVIKKLQKDNNFTYLRKKNEGLVKTLNGEIEQLDDQYEYLSIIASDDRMLENRVATFMGILNKYDLTNVGAIFTGYRIINESGSVVYTKKYENAIRLTVDEYFGYRWLAAPTAFINVRALKAVGGYSERYRIEDFYLWHKLLSKGYEILVVPDVTVEIRKHSNNMSGNKMRMLIQELKILSEYGVNVRVMVAVVRSIMSVLVSYIRK